MEIEHMPNLPPLADDLVYGLEAISRVIGRSRRQTHYALKQGHIPAKQVGSRWVVRRSELERFFTTQCAVKTDK